WNSMMSMAGGWFFLTVTEAFQLGDKDFRLPGLGSYMSYASEKGDNLAKFYGIIAMVLMIIALDQFLWRPLVVWGQKFRVEEGGGEEGMHSWFLDFLNRSPIVQALLRLFQRKPAPLKEEGAPMSTAPADARPKPISGPPTGVLKFVSILAFALLMAAMLFGAWKIVQLFLQVKLPQWEQIFGEAAVTMGRVLAAVALSALWTVPMGLWIGLSPRLSRIAQPFIQVAASFPSPMLFTFVIAVMHFMGMSLGWGSIFLILLGTQWYILFNVAAGAMAIPSDLREAAELYQIRGWRRFWKVHLPGIFPYFVTGLVTATGNAWNTTIVAEYVTDKGQTLTAFGLGSQISVAAASADFP
ncbi:MAG TPA: ABC transporter permease subunit, partial [bacterium]|nr:ABC transporter permease subunit [bacterium]